jgi:DUF1365 family protein
MINSALYHGEVMHQRFAPRQHRFTYQLTSWLIDIDELPQLDQNLKGFGWNKRALFSFIDTDYGFGDGIPARVFIDTMLKDFNLPRAHRVELLCQVRCLGFVFNPLAVWFCYDEQERLTATLYEVRNTFKQRHHYFVPETVTPRTAEEASETTRQTHNQTGHQTIPVYHHHRSEKNFYVSPFMPMDCQYEFRFQRPDAHLNLTIQQTSQGKPLMVAAWRGERQTLSQTALNSLAVRHPLSTLKIIFAIHWEALRLWIKGMRLITRPAPPTHLVTRGQPINKRER